MDAYLDHLFHHPNVAPFISYRLIQRFTTSNPSPRYIRAVAAAFSTGSYDGATYSGRYGDLNATIHAILLDREARTTTLDADPTSGRLREPILKVRSTLSSAAPFPNLPNPPKGATPPQIPAVQPAERESPRRFQLHGGRPPAPSHEAQPQS
jgi:uncharacterized protein (DUF1800 family)